MKLVLSWTGTSSLGLTSPLTPARAWRLKQAYRPSSLSAASAPLSFSPRRRLATGSAEGAAAVIAVPASGLTGSSARPMSAVREESGTWSPAWSAASAGTAADPAAATGCCFNGRPRLRPEVVAAVPTPVGAAEEAGFEAVPVLVSRDPFSGNPGMSARGCCGAGAGSCRASGNPLLSCHACDAQSSQWNDSLGRAASRMSCSEMDPLDREPPRPHRPRSVARNWTASASWRGKLATPNAAPGTLKLADPRLLYRMGRSPSKPARAWPVEVRQLASAANETAISVADAARRLARLALLHLLHTHRPEGTS